MSSFYRWRDWVLEKVSGFYYHIIAMQVGGNIITMQVGGNRARFEIRAFCWALWIAMSYLLWGADYYKSELEKWLETIEEDLF